MATDLMTKLKEVVGSDRMSDRPADCEAYRFASNSIDFDIKAPDIVVLPVSADEVVQIVRLADTYNVPVVARGKGTAFLGNNVPQRGGILVDMSLMNRILSIDKDSMVAVVEAGCVVNEFFNILDKQDLMFPIRPWLDPQMQMGAWISCNGNGDFSNVYGTVGQAVTGLEVVLPSGEKIRLGSWAREKGYGPYIRYPGGPDLVGLFTGSVGTLGIITQIALRLLDKPKYVVYGAFGWPREDTQNVGKASHAFLRSRNMANYSVYNYRTFRNAIKGGLLTLPKDIYFVTNAMAFANTESEAQVKREEMRDIGLTYGRDLGSETCRAVQGPPFYAINAGHYNLTRSIPKRTGAGTAWCQFYFYGPVLKFSEWWNFFEKKVSDYGFLDSKRGPWLWAWAIPPEVLAPFPAFGYQTGDPDEVTRMKQAFKDIMGGLLTLGCTPYSLGAFLPVEEERATLGSSYRLYQMVKNSLDPKGLFNPGQI